MKTIILFAASAALMLTGCIATAPISFAWRSNSSQQYATTEGQNGHEAKGAHSVNADRTTELQSAVSTNAGTASTAEQSHDDSKE